MAMPAKQGLRSKSTYVGETWKSYPAGVADLVADSPSGKHCARRVVIDAAGNFTHLYNAKGVDVPLLARAAGYVHDADTSYVDCNVAFTVYW